MASVKISELNASANLNVNPAHSIFPTTDTDTGDTTKISAKDLGDTLFSNNTLIVGSGGYVLPNLVAQFTGVGPSYVQVNAQNLNANGSADFIITADDGDDVSYYLDLGLNNSDFVDANFSSMKSHDGYLYVHGNGAPAVGNLVVGTATSGANIVFITGGTVSENIRAVIANSGLVLTDGSVITFRDGTIQTTAAAPNSYSYSAYSFANNINAYAFSAYAYANTVNAYAYSTNNYVASVNTSVYTANTFLQANDAVTLNVSLNYTDTANTNLKSYADGRFLANVSGTFNGDLNIAGIANVSGGRLIVANSTYDTANVALVSITGAPGGVTLPPPQSGYMLDITGLNGIPSRVVNNAYGANTFALFGGRKANGTAASPTAVANNDVISRFGSSGHNGTSFVVGGQSRIDFVAAENYTTTNTGSRIEFWNTPIGSNVISKIASFNGNSVEVTGVLEPKKGFIYTPNVISGSTTTLNIDIANNSLYKCSSSTGLTVNLSGFQWGKVVELWFTNTGGSTQTVTHGCYANNSTINSTSFSMPSSSSAYLRYFSIDGDLANTFVAIQHA